MITNAESQFGYTNVIRNICPELFKLISTYCFNTIKLINDEAFEKHLSRISKSGSKDDSPDIAKTNLSGINNNTVIDQHRTKDIDKFIKEINDENNIVHSYVEEESYKRYEKISTDNEHLYFIKQYELTDFDKRIPISYCLETSELFSKLTKEVNTRIYKLISENQTDEFKNKTLRSHSQNNNYLDTMIIQLNNTDDYPISVDYNTLVGVDFAADRIKRQKVNGGGYSYQDFQFTTESIITKISDGSVASNLSKTLGRNTNYEIGNIDIVEKGLFENFNIEKMILTTVSLEHLFQIAYQVWVSHIFSKDNVDAKPDLEIFNIMFDERYYKVFRDKIVLTTLIHLDGVSNNYRKYITSLSKKGMEVAKTNQMTMLENKIKNTFDRFKTMINQPGTKSKYINPGIINILSSDLENKIITNINTEYSHVPFERIDTITNLHFYLNNNDSQLIFLEKLLTFLFIEIYKIKYQVSSFRCGLATSASLQMIENLKQRVEGCGSYEDKDFYREILTSVRFKELFNNYDTVAERPEVKNAFKIHSAQVELLTSIFSIINIYLNSLSAIHYIEDEDPANNMNISKSTISHIRKFGNDSFLLLLQFLADKYGISRYRISVPNMVIGFSDYAKEYNVAKTTSINVIKRAAKYLDYIINTRKNITNFDFRGDKKYRHEVLYIPNNHRSHYTTGSVMDNVDDCESIVKYICEFVASKGVLINRYDSILND